MTRRIIWPRAALALLGVLLASMLLSFTFALTVPIPLLTFAGGLVGVLGVSLSLPWWFPIVPSPAVKRRTEDELT